MSHTGREQFLFTNGTIRVHIQKFRAEDYRENKEVIFFDLDLGIEGSENAVVELTQFYREKVFALRVEYPNSVVLGVHGQPHFRIIMECKSEDEANRELARLSEFLECRVGP
jgi:hypothetical protein